MFEFRRNNFFANIRSNRLNLVVLFYYLSNAGNMTSEDWKQLKFDARKLQWSGQTLETDTDINQSLGEAIINSLKVNGPRVAQICANTGITKTFEQLRGLTINTAINLQSLRCRKGDLICILTENTADVAPIIFAALYLGVKVATLPVYFSIVEFESFLKILRPKILFCDVDIYRKLKNCLKFLNNDAPIFTFDSTVDESISVNILFASSAAVTLEPAEINAFTHVAYILKTSGTSGNYKCVQISHASILDKIRSLKCIFGPSDVVLGFTRLYGVSGIRSLFGSILNGSTRIVNHHPFSPKRYFDIVDKFKVTVSIGAAKLPVHLLDHEEIEFANLSSLKFFCVGGTKVSNSVIQNMRKHLPGGRFCQTYGMTETTGTIAMNMSHMRNDSVGQLIRRYNAKIIDEAGERLGIGEIGEICLKFPCPILGYLGDEQNVNNYLDSEGFFMTGDLGKFDKNADLFIVDRIKDVFKCFGYTVTPSEIEEYLNKIDGVKQSCVVPIPDPDQNFNYLPASLVVKTSTSKCTEQSIYDWVANNFSFFKHLRGGVYFVDDLPVNSREKVDRNLVKAMAIELFKKLKIK